MLIRKFTAVATLLFTTLSSIADERVISKAELSDRIMGFWNGQLLGNYIGFPFENLYREEPIPILIERVYTADYDGEIGLRINKTDRRGHIPVLAASVGGAFSDDDTDVEFVTLHAVETYGLDITYPEITQAWKTHINDFIWVANREARTLMDQGFVAPDTGRKENNKHWFQIDPQLVNEIWSAFYPGMVKQATERALWGARITNDDWGTHATMAYAAMISAAFFEDDVDELVKLAVTAVPRSGPFAEGIRDVIRWHQKNDDWRLTRQLIHDKYWAYKQDGYAAPVSVVSSLNNGLTGIMAILYGEGDYTKTVGIATSAGYDCDNQAATLGGLIGVMKGMSGLNDSVVEQMKTLPAWHAWEEPFNNTYVNISRDEIALRTPITEIVERIVAVAETAIRDNGGRMEYRDGETYYVINSNL
jgi:hypothetical protein